MLNKLFKAVGRGIERAVENVILDAIEGSTEKGTGRRKGCIRTWLADFRLHPGGVHIIIGKQRSGKTALCYYLAQQTGKKPIYAITAAKEVPIGVEVIYNIDALPPGSVCLVDDASLFFNSMRTKKTDDNYQLLRDLLIFSEKEDMCILFNAHDTSLLNKTAFSQARTIFLKEPNLMAIDTERPGIRRILENVQQGFNRIKKGQREAYFFLFSADCRGWGKAPLPAGWSQKISTSCKILDAEFHELRGVDEGKDAHGEPEDFEEKQPRKPRRKRDDEQEESFDEFKKHEKGEKKD